jgi:hypothetical protein
MAQQLWVSLVSHKSSNEFAPLVEEFLDQHLDRVSDDVEGLQRPHCSSVCLVVLHTCHVQPIFLLGRV